MWQYNYSSVSSELSHHGVLGMKWGHRKNYRSTGIRAAIARKQNEKVDEGFKKWKENDKLRDDAISSGKKANDARLQYEKNPNDRSLKKEYGKANGEYRKALRKNTTYRKGYVRQEVGKDAARKYLSEARKTQKQIKNDPKNRELQKKYSEYMSKHDINRAKARKAVSVGEKRSRKIASMKRAMTISAKAAAGLAITSAGLYAVNKYFLHGKYDINSEQIVQMAKKAKAFMGFMY